MNEYIVGHDLEETGISNVRDVTGDRGVVETKIGRIALMGRVMCCTPGGIGVCSAPQGHRLVVVNLRR